MLAFVHPTLSRRCPGRSSLSPSTHSEPLLKIKKSSGIVHVSQWVITIWNSRPRDLFSPITPVVTNEPVSSTGDSFASFIS